MGIWQNCVVAVISEFGRRNFENGSSAPTTAGASCVLLTGGAVAPGEHGVAPTDQDLAQSVLPYAVDFRAIYAQILRDHLGLADPSHGVRGAVHLAGGRRPGVTMRSPCPLPWCFCRGCWPPVRAAAAAPRRSLDYGGSPLLLRVGEPVAARRPPGQRRRLQSSCRRCRRTAAGRRRPARSPARHRGCRRPRRPRRHAATIGGTPELTASRCSIAIGAALPAEVASLEPGFAIERFASADRSLPASSRSRPTGASSSAERGSGVIRLVDADGHAAGDPVRDRAVTTGSHRGLLGLAAVAGLRDRPAASSRSATCRPAAATPSAACSTAGPTSAASARPGRAVRRPAGVGDQQRRRPLLRRQRHAGGQRRRRRVAGGRAVRRRRWPASCCASTPTTAARARRTTRSPSSPCSARACATSSRSHACRTRVGRCSPPTTARPTTTNCCSCSRRATSSGVRPPARTSAPRPASCCGCGPTSSCRPASRSRAPTRPTGLRAHQRSRCSWRSTTKKSCCGLQMSGALRTDIDLETPFLAMQPDGVATTSRSTCSADGHGRLWLLTFTAIYRIDRIR
jgi:hypothetical protein